MSFKISDSTKKLLPIISVVMVVMIPAVFAMFIGETELPVYVILEFRIFVIIIIGYVMWRLLVRDLRFKLLLKRREEEVVTDVVKQEIEDKVIKRMRNISLVSEDLEESNALLTSVFQSMYSGLLIIPKDGDSTVVNGAFLKVWRLPGAGGHESKWQLSKLLSSMQERLDKDSSRQLNSQLVSTAGRETHDAIIRSEIGKS